MKDQALYCIALTMPNSIIAEVNFLNIILPPFLFNCWAFLSHTQDLSRKEKQHNTEHAISCIGDLKEIRTPVAGLRGQLPRPLEDEAK